MAAAGLKLLAEAVVFLHLRDRHHSVGKRLALLMKGDLRSVAAARFLCGALGGLVLPALGLAPVSLLTTGNAMFPLPALTAVALAACALSLAGELCERYLFFAAAPASKMPGGIG